MRPLVLAWWFFFALSSGGAGLGGPFETEAGCEKVRKEFNAWTLDLGAPLKCTSDRFDR